jgi:multidrug efflux pump subunit AcrB
VVVSLIIFQLPMGFVAQLGVIALAGMIMRNSVILIDQINKHLELGQSPYEAIVESTLLRFRPIVLTAAAAALGMIPLISSTFWGPMAVAIMGGLLVATVLTLIYLPAVYAACFKVEVPHEPAIVAGQDNIKV